MHSCNVLTDAANNHILLWSMTKKKSSNKKLATRGKKRISKPRRSQRKTKIVPRAIGSRGAKSPEISNRVAHAVAKMRKEGISLKQAARDSKIDPRTIVRLGRSALLKLENGRYVAKDSDRISRVLLIPTTDGLREITLSDSREASQLGKYWDAVHKYLGSGDATVLRKFEGKSLKSANRERIPLLTNLNELDRLGSAGVLSFESVYARSH
jgi:hypothetical protein